MVIGREREGEGQGRLPDRQWVDGAGEGGAGDLGEADLMGRQGIRDEISSPRVHSVLAP